jgi:predicted signal transduction protein with EAL and GGDEF domain/DNA-binding response OmpR family regulator
VLVVDDDPVTRLLVVEVLEGAEFDVAEAQDGAEAVAAFAAQRPDLVLLDVVMPGSNGYDVCRSLRALPGGVSVPIVMMTGLDDVASIHEAYEGGATDFITKPVNGSLLPHRLRYLLRAAAAFRDARDSSQRLARAQRLASIAQWELELATGAFRWSEEARPIFGITDAGRVGDAEAMLSLVHPEDRPAVARALASPSGHRLEYRMVAPEGRERKIHQEAEMIVDEVDGKTRLVGAAQDVTELRTAERRVRTLAYFDGVTGLPNRAFLHKFLSYALAAAQRAGNGVAVLSLDLDLFKRVNDTHGHAAGDALLREVAARLNASVRASDALAGPDGSMPLETHLAEPSVASRLGGDEFVVILTQLRHPEDTAFVAQRIVERLAPSFTIGAAEVFISASIGIATFPENGTSVDVLLEHADAAMYQVKDSGRNGYQFFSPAVHEKARRRREIETGLRAALRVRTAPGRPPDRTPFELHYQPILHVPSNEPASVEALLRWNPDGQGMISPAEFIPVAEDTGLVVPLGRWVMGAACAAARELAAAGHRLRMAVNVAARQFREPGFVESVAAVLNDTGVAPDRLELEITERTVMDDLTSGSHVLGELKRLGVRIALDDFGTGYSSLSYLTRLPIDVLKIDRSFVRDLGTRSRTETVTAAIIGLARGLGIDIVAEGVETEEQLAFLRAHGPVEVQGFLFAKPMPRAALTDWLAPRAAAEPGEPASDASLRS